MKWLINFFKWFKDLIITVYEFFVNSVDNIKKMAELVADAVTDAYSFVDQLPWYLKSFATITIVVSVVYMFIGRDSGGK